MEEYVQNNYGELASFRISDMRFVASKAYPNQASSFEQFQITVEPITIAEEDGLDDGEDHDRTDP